MAKNNEDLAREIKELREEVQQMKEILSLLFTLVAEQEGEEDDEDFISDQGMPSVNDFKTNN
jgi:cell division septum initiation protein DivIVA